MRRSLFLGPTLAVPIIAVLAACGGSATPSASHFSQLVPQVQKGNPPPSEIWNAFEAAPTGTKTPTDFEVTFSGNITGIATDPLINIYNPFCPPSNSFGCSPTVSHNYSNNTTTLEYSGTLYQNEAPSSSCYPCYHFGDFGSSNLMGIPATTAWTYPSAPALPWWFVNVKLNQHIAKSKNWAYAEVYIDVSLSKGGSPVYGGWQDIGYVPKGSGQPKFTFANYGKMPLYVHSSGIILNQQVPTDPKCRKDPGCPEDMAILATLNYAGSPPPGYPNSQFIALKYPPPSVLKPQRTP